MKVQHKHASPAHFSPWHPKWMNEILGYIKLLRLRQHLLPLRSTLSFFFFSSINWFRKIEIPRKKVRQRWKQTIKSWNSARCQASCASCNRQISLKHIPGELVFENITGGRAHQNKMLGWSLDAQGQYIFNNSDYSQSRKTFSPNRKQFLTVRISHIVDWVQDVLL